MNAPQAISPALGRALQSARSAFNARVSEACRIRPGFDTGTVDALLRGPLDRLAAQAEGIAPERTGSLVLAAFDVGLALARQGKSEHPLMSALWDVASACLPLALRQPRETLGRIFNAGLHLLSVNGARPEQWTREMTRLAGRATDLACLERLGQVLAWRSGLAHFRESALRLAHDLPPELVAEALAIAEGEAVAATLARLGKDPWFDPARPDRRGLRATREVGGFVGFGGPFPCPPEVRALGEGFVVQCANRFWYLCADAFGAALHAGSKAEFEAGAADSGDLDIRGSAVIRGLERCALDLPPERLSLARGPYTAALSSPYSHFIRLLALS
jgi:hypothetical protein